jgi:hypothetical protein
MGIAIVVLDSGSREQAVVHQAPDGVCVSPEL